MLWLLKFGIRMAFEADDSIHSEMGLPRYCCITLVLTVFHLTDVRLITADRRP